MDRLAYSVSELCKVLGIGRNTAYELAHTQGFPAVQIGRRLIVPIDALNEWLKERGAERAEL